MRLTKSLPEGPISSYHRTRDEVSIYKWGLGETCIWSVAAGPVPIPKGGMKDEPRATALPEWWSRVTAGGEGAS